MKLDEKTVQQFERYRPANYSPDFFSILSVFILISIVICKSAFKEKKEKKGQGKKGQA